MGHRTGPALPRLALPAPLWPAASRSSGPAAPLSPGTPPAVIFRLARWGHRECSQARRCGSAEAQAAGCQWPMARQPSGPVAVEVPEPRGGLLRSRLADVAASMSDSWQQSSAELGASKRGQLLQVGTATRRR